MHQHVWDGARMAVVVMGVSGCGKSTVGRALAERLGWPFLDADDYHPPANVQKMSSGKPLDDTDRVPWLGTLNQLLRDQPRAVLACSALKRAYRDTLRAGQPEPVVFVYLRADREAIAARLLQREHFFPPHLLDTQFAALEEPAENEALIVDATEPVDQLVAAIVSRL